MSDDRGLQLGPPPKDFLSFLGVRTARRTPDEGGPVSAAILSRLTVADRHAFETGLTGDVARHFRESDELERTRMLPGAIVLLGLTDAARDARIPTAVAPVDDNAPAQVRVAASGDTWGADVLADALRRAGVSLADGTVLAEIDCGHGERMRLLSSLLPGLEVTGCNREPGQAAWVTEFLPPLGAHHQDREDALPFADASVDVLAGLTPLSGVAADAGTRIVRDALRVLRPGGAFALCFRGWSAFAHDVATGRVDGGDASATLRGLYRSGHHLTSGGRAYLTLEWLMAAAGEAFRLELHQLARTSVHEDVAVLVRRS